jgi:cadmium resistance protein CadD (predicted permease)
MRDCLVLVGVGAVVFASTNVDDLFVLLGFFSDPRFRVRHVVLGQYLGIATLTAASVALALAALVIPPAYVGLLGVAPLAIGLGKLLRRGATAEEERTASPQVNVLAVAAVTVANGGDNLAVYAPLFATRRPWEIGMLSVVFLVMTGLWCGAARSLIRHPTLGRPIRTYGRRVLPWVLVALGAYILFASGALRLLTRIAR